MLLLILVTVYVVLGNFYDHTGLIVAMDEMDLFENGKYDFSLRITFSLFLMDTSQKYEKKNC